MNKKVTGCLAILLLLASVLLLVGCAPPVNEEIAEPTVGQIPVNTEFGRMLGFVPYSFLEEHDIWFGNPGKAKQLHGFQDVKSYEAWTNLSDKGKKSYADAIRGIANPTSIGLREPGRFAQVFGFDGMMVNRAVFVEIPPPGLFAIMEGDFDEDLILGKLTELGYEETKHGSFTYHKLFGDYEIHMDSEVTQVAMASMNRVSVLDDTIITSPVTDILTCILDAMAEDEISVIDDAACRALANSMGEVLSAVIMTPDRVLNPAPGHGEIPPFSFTIPEDWGLLHQYDMVGMGYKDDSEERYWVISLYYTDEKEASADTGELVKRMKSYILYTNIEHVENISLASRFEVGEPTVRQYPGGAALTVSCRLYPETGNGSWIPIVMVIRDLLFLAPDPSPFVEE